MADRRVRLIAWSRGEAAGLAASLRAGGSIVDARRPRLPGLFRELSRRPPAVVVIDLRSLPLQGRDLGVALRVRAGPGRSLWSSSRATRT